MRPITDRKVCKTFGQKEPCQLLPLNKRKLLPMIAAKVFLLLVKEGKNCITTLQKEITFLFRIEENETWRFLTEARQTGCQQWVHWICPFSWASVCTSTLYSHHSAIVGNLYGKQWLSEQQWDRSEEKWHHYHFYKKDQSPERKKRAEELRVWSKATGTWNATNDRVFPAEDNCWSLVIQSWTSAPWNISSCCHLGIAV